MRHNIKCAICGSLFNSLNDNAKYCSKDCKAAGAKETRKNWLANNPTYEKNRMKEYRAKNKLPPKFWKA